MSNPGVYLSAADELFEVPQDKAALRTRPREVGAWDLTDPSNAPALGPFASTDPIPIRSLAKSGVVSTSFFEDYYNRLYLIPSVLDFGAISGSVDVQLTVWNAFFRTTILNTITLTELEGVSLSGPALPTTFKPLAVQAYTVTATEDGPATIDGEIDFDLVNNSNPLVVTLRVSGVRSYLVPFRPNWRDGVRISYEYRTEILTSDNGKEQRRALRQTPRKVIEFSALATLARLRKANQILHGVQHRPMVLPEYPRKAVLAQATEPGSAAVVLEAVPYWLSVGTNVLLVSGERQEPRRVETITENLVVFNVASGDPWPAGALVHPALNGFLAESLQTRRETSAVGVLSVTFNVAPGAEILPATGYPVQVFAGREVFLKKPNWATQPTLTYEHPRADVDYGQGRVGRYTPIAFPARLYRATYLGRTFPEADEIRDFFDRMKGQRGEFYMPTWEPDIVLGEHPSPVATSTIRVPGTDLAQGHTNDTVFKALAVFFNDGAVVLNGVQNIVVVTDADGRDTLITCTAPWARELNRDSVRMISWLPVWRHATDKLTIDWLTSSAAQFELTLRTLEDLPASNGASLSGASP